MRPVPEEARLRPRPVLLTLAVLLAGCTLSHVRQGAPLRSEQAGAVAVGDTKGRVLEVLGPPDSMQAIPGGSMFVYVYRSSEGRELEINVFNASASWSREDRRADRLLVRFDREGRVVLVGRPVGRPADQPETAVTSARSAR